MTDMNIYYLMKNVLMGKDDNLPTKYLPVDNLGTFE